MSFDDLVNVEVTSVSGRPEPLWRVASAVQVLTQQDIRRSGATRLPEVLRLVANLEVVQIDSNQWAISARGFNSPLANKLLVLIDGRTIYSPLFAGVFWDAQDVLLEDIERIEVISGPGATLWGANAVNGVINITTKNTTNTQGALVEAGAGTALRGFGNLRYGGAVARKTTYRLYAKYFARDGAILPDGQEAPDDWQMGQAGFRLDRKASPADLLTLQGDLYRNEISATGPHEAATGGANLTGRWTRTLSTNADIQLQAYIDRIHREVPGQYDDVLDTYDVNFEQRQRLPSGRHELMWGASYRAFDDDFGAGSLIFVPRQVVKQTIGAFVQDEVSLVRDRVGLILGTKIRHDPYSGFEYQPSVRVAWTLSNSHTVWTALSRAVRTPSRLDRDLIVPPVTAGGPDFQSERVLAYELGYRARPHARVSLSAASYYHAYDGIRSIELETPPAPYPLIFANGQRGESYGLELSADIRGTDWWQIRFGLTEQRIDIRPKPGSDDRSFGQGESATSNRHLTLRSAIDLRSGLRLDPTLRFVSAIANPTVRVASYAELDVHLAWQVGGRLTLSIVGQNLLHDHHPEIGGTGARDIARSVYTKVSYGR